MKLIGATNGKQVVSSISHYDCRSIDGAMRDGGQPHTSGYAGYTRGSGETIWFEVKQNFAELYNDYNFNRSEPRKYGIWDLKDIKILKEEEYINLDSFEEKVENAIWGTLGLDGKGKLRYVLLKDCSIDHLEAILKNVSNINPETKAIIKYLIK